MLGFARYAMQSPLRTGILAAVLAVLPFLYVISAALVALATLRHGISAGTRVLSAAIVGGLVSWLLTGVPLSLLVLTLVALLAIVLRESRSWSRTLIAGAFIALAFALIGHDQFNEVFGGLMSFMQRAVTNGDTSTVEWQMLEAMKPYGAFVIMASEITEALTSLVLARYWQAGLYNPGGFKAEMHNLRFSRMELAALMVAIMLVLQMQPGALLLFGFPFVIVGIASIHGIVAKLNLGGQWLVALYILLMLANQIIVPLLIMLVLIDSFVDIRRWIQDRSRSDNE
ncbi:MAG: hypothetical protein P8X89_01350 [Reinekea sp.]